MTDLPNPDDPDPSPKGARRLFGFARRTKPDPELDKVTETAKPQHAAMRLRLAEFEQARVEDVMIPRADIVAVEVETPFDALVRVFAEATHSRLPVYRETLDNPIGFVHIKDMVGEIARGVTETSSLERIARNTLVVPPSMPLADLLVKMQATRIHLAIVVDEYGGTDGLVSLEDLVEEIVGDIEDEHDEDTPLLTRRGPNLWEADARMEIEDFATETGVNLELEDYEDEIDTLGGIAFALAGRVPERGEVLRHPNAIDIEIIDADSRRIRRMKLRRVEPRHEQAG
ncbi:MAG: hemolysin family protein [Pseudomonadota bacterium]